MQYNVLNRSLPKLTPPQIAARLAIYKQMPNSNNEQTIQLADHLFIAAISGSSQAKKDLIHFKDKFTALDGAYGEECGA
ncbi:hypothetical protein ACUN24_20750 [Pedobacter sp. WC2501]|uniref:hypothetical protein n=1 Tax=Pedobacter sp. WC2501 TaxID=3461400 RepID=UPI0040467909